MSKITTIMESVPYTCLETATVGDVIKHLVDLQVESVPIVDEYGRLKGYISDSDIMRFIAHRKAKIYDFGDMTSVDVDDVPFEEKVRELFDIPVLEIADRKKVYVTTEDEIDDVADLLKAEKVRKIAILEGGKNGKVVGVITRSMMIRYILTDIMAW